MTTNHPRLAPTFLLALVVSTVACAGNPLRELEQARSRHRATLQSFVVRDDPASGQQQILLDLLLERDGVGEPIPGITLDVSMADAQGVEKAHRRVWVEAAGLGPGGLQTAITLEGLPFEPGDGFYVEVRSPVPEAERTEYREFAGLTAGGS